MASSPIYVGYTSPGWKVQLTDDTGAVVALTGYAPSDVVFHMFNADLNKFKVCSGVWTFVDVANGIMTYNWQPGDVDTVGTWQRQVYLKNTAFDPVPLVINAPV